MGRLLGCVTLNNGRWSALLYSGTIRTSVFGVWLLPFRPAVAWGSVGNTLLVLASSELSVVSVTNVPVAGGLTRSLSALSREEGGDTGKSKDTGEGKKDGAFPKALS